MSKNYDIKTVSKYLGGVSSHVALGSSVPSGMKRYVTFLRIQQLAETLNEGSKIYICSTAASNTASSTGAASTAQKMVIQIPSTIAATGDKEVRVPERPDTEHPLFTIAGGKWLTAYLCSDAGQSYPVSIFAQYYDE